MTLETRLCRYLTAVAAIWFALAAAWGFAAPLGGGHYGSMGGMGIAAENILRWHVIGPVPQYVELPPLPSSYYCHHPWGVFWDLVPLLAVFGHHDWVLWLPALVMSASIPLLLYGIGEDAWGPVGGAAAACGFVVVPIAVGFANFHSLELMVIFGCTLFFWGHSRMLATAQPRFLWASLAGAAVALSGDWPGFVAVAAILGWGLLRAHVLPPQWTPFFPRGIYERWWALSAAISLALLALWLGLFIRSDKLLDWLGSAGGRSSGVGLASALAGRKHWIELMFTPLVILLGKIALPIALLRIAVRRRDEEVYSVAIFIAAAVQYLAFPQGADIHIFWPHYFAAYFALALAQLVVTLRSAVLLVASRIRVERARVVFSFVPLVFIAAVFLTLLPDAIRTLKFARESGGRYNERGWPTPSSQDTILLLHRLHAASKDAVIEAHASMQWRWYHMWAWQGMSRADQPLPQTPLPAGRPTYFLARPSWLTGREQIRLASTFHVESYGDIWLIDLHAPHALLDAFSFEEREPSPWEWYVFGGWQPIRKIVPDTFATWEARTHLGQPCQPPDAEPVTLEQKRIAHNVAVSTGDFARAGAIRREIEARIEGKSGVPFSQGIRLLGVSEVGGVEPRVESWFDAAGPIRADVVWVVHSKLDGAKRWSLIPPDPVEREVSRPMWPATSIWRPGFLYKHTTVLWHRIGVERFWGFWRSEVPGSVPARLDGGATTDLIVVP